jgi:hypothetical protein
MDRPAFYQENSTPQELRNLLLVFRNVFSIAASRRDKRNRLNTSPEIVSLEKSRTESLNVIEHHAPIMRNFRNSFNKFRSVLVKKVKKVHSANNPGRAAIGGQANRLRLTEL